MKEYKYPADAGKLEDLKGLAIGTVMQLVDADSKDSAQHVVTLGEPFREVDYDEMTTHEAWGRTEDGELMLIVLEVGDEEGQAKIACDSTGTQEYDDAKCQSILESLEIPEEAAEEEEEEEEETSTEEEQPAAENTSEEEEEEEESPAEEAAEEEEEEEEDDSPADEEEEEESVEEEDSPAEEEAAEEEEEEPASEQKTEEKNPPAAKKEKKEKGPSRREQVKALLEKDPDMKCAAVSKELGMNYSYCNRVYKEVKAELEAEK